MKSLISLFIISSLFVNQKSFSKEFISIIPQSSFINSNQELVYQIVSSLPKEYLKKIKIKPITNKIQPKIWNNRVNSWINTQTIWSELPNLSEDFKLIFPAVIGGQFQIKFEILDEATGRKYLTPSQHLWDSNIYEKYLERIKLTV